MGSAEESLAAEASGAGDEVAADIGQVVRSVDFGFCKENDREWRASEGRRVWT